MTRAVTKTIEFDFYFQFSRSGTFEQGNQITVCEPNYDKRDVYRTMRGYMGEAEKGLMKIFKDVPMPTVSEEAAAPSSEASEPPDLLEQMRLTLGVEGYSKFCDYVQRQLTGHLSLCYIGNSDTPLTERIVVNEAVWGDIVEKGGMEQLDRVLTAFGSFFTASRSETKKVQTVMPGTTSSLPPAQSPPARSKSRPQS